MYVYITFCDSLSINKNFHFGSNMTCPGRIQFSVGKAYMMIGEERKLCDLCFYTLLTDGKVPAKSYSP